MARPKKVARSQPPRAGAGAKQAKAVQPENDYGKSKPIISFWFADVACNGEFGWPPSADDSLEVLTFLQQISQSTWNEIRGQLWSNNKSTHRKHHHQDFDKVAPEAQERIRALQLDRCFDTLFRFRLGAKKRLWGCEQDGVFHVLWWDPNHRVYPTEAG